MTLYAYIPVIVAGSVCGALANWIAATLPYRNREGMPPSCGPLHYWSLAALIRGRRSCLYCGAAYPVRYPLLEIAIMTGFAFSLYLQGRWSVDLLITWVYIVFLLTVLVIDYEHRRVLNAMLGPAALFALLVSLRFGLDGLLNALLGGAVGFGFFLLLALIGRGKLGAGDVKLAGVIGLMTGYPTVFGALILGVLLGGLAALFLLVSRRATRKSYMAYGPYLALGAMVALWVPELMTGF